MAKSDIKRWMIVKIRDLIEKLNLEIDSLPEADLELEIKGLTIHTKDESNGFKAYIINEATHKTKNNLETLGYSFEVGV